MTTDQPTEVKSLNGVRVYPALSVMERTVPPLRYGRQPLWRHPSVIDELPLVPSWNWWAVRDFAPGTHSTILDTNGAYIGAIGQAIIGHCQLTRSGPIAGYPDHRSILPGYYKITIPNWAFSGTIVSPLGNNAHLQEAEALGKPVWICAPTLVLLVQLAEDGYIGAFDILDSYTAEFVTNWRNWSKELGKVRIDRLDERDASHPDGQFPDKCPCLPCRRYEAFKEGYGSALSMMLTGNGCKTDRSDWAYTVYATHAANQWRKAWRYTDKDTHLISMGHVDEIQIVTSQLPTALARTSPPFRLDPTGRSIGAMKIKRTTVLQDTPTAPAGPTISSLDLGDIV